MLAISLFLASQFAEAPGPPKNANADALKELKGEWGAVFVQEKGEAWDDKTEIAKVVIEISGDTLIYKRIEPFEKFRFTLDLKQKPAQIDLRLIAKGTDPNKACHGIFAFEDERLKLCLHSEFTATDPKDRPGEFSTGDRKPAQGQLFFVFERIKK